MSKRRKIKTLTPSVLTSEFAIYGDFIGEGAAEISCKIHGNIRCLSVVINEEAVVIGDVIAERVEVYGEVNGNVRAKNVVCGPKAKIIGDIIHEKIQIENGAYIDGSCKKFYIEEV